MALSYDLLSQFAKIVNQDKKTNNESTVYGKVVVDDNGAKYVQLYGSDQLTPLGAASATVNEDDRVSVLIKDHTATVTGNISFPAARTEDVENLGKQVTEIQEFDILMGQKIQAQEGYIQDLQADVAEVGELKAAVAKVNELVADKATIEDLNAAKAEITDLKTTKLDAEVANITYATIENLTVINEEVVQTSARLGEFQDLTAENFEAINGTIKNLDSTYANVDFANIGEAAIRKIFSDTGIIKDLVVGDSTITGELVGVTIKGDLIEGNTIKADKLVVKGSDGIYYKLNVEAGGISAEEAPTDSLHGSVITAKSITAEKVSVKDLVAFGATIGGFNITDRSLYSGAKSSVDNSTRGIYFDTDAQFNIGDAYNFLRYYQVSSAEAFISNDSIVVIATEDGLDISASIADNVFCLSSTDKTSSAAARIEDGVFEVHNDVYKLEIAAESIVFGADSSRSVADLRKLTEHVKIGTIIDKETGDEKPCIELAEGDSDFKQVITNANTQFMDGETIKTTIDKDGIQSDNITVNNELRQGGFIWASRPNGNYGLTWVKGVTS